MPETDPASSEEPALSEEPVPPEEPGVPEERSSLAGIDWWRGARWFGAEYLIVVLGVLTAVALNAWWGDLQDRNREAEYISQLRTDIDLTLAGLDSTEQLMKFGDQTSLGLVRAFQRPTLPPADSLWWGLYALTYAQDPVAVTRTADALLATGDLQLIRDDSVRQAVTFYVDMVENRRGHVQHNDERRARATAALLRRVDRAEMYRTILEREVPDWWSIGDTSRVGPREVRTPLDPATIFDDQEAYQDAWELLERRHFLKRNRQDLRRFTLELGGVLDRRVPPQED